MYGQLKGYILNALGADVKTSLAVCLAYLEPENLFIEDGQIITVGYKKPCCPLLELSVASK